MHIGIEQADVPERLGAASLVDEERRWSWRHCAELTVEQYREVLAMPQNVVKLRRNGRV